MSSPDLADLFPGFASHWIDTSIGRMFARSGGSGPPLLLLHGYAESNVMWHRVSPELARHFTLILPDLPGYGWSVAPRASADHEPYSKRAMAAVMIEIMEKLGHVRFRLAGHDRGARVAYRLALDHPGRVSRLATLDIVPTLTTFQRTDKAMATATFHWFFLIQPFDLPERMIGAGPAYWLRTLLGRWSDGQLDEADLGHRKIACPMLALWGSGRRGRHPDDVVGEWRKWADDVRGHAIDCGHFLPEEAPAETAAALREFLSA